jgi:hypothetical protein
MMSRVLIIADICIQEAVYFQNNPKSMPRHEAENLYCSYKKGITLSE